MHGDNVFKAALEFAIGAVKQALHMVQDTLSSLQCIKKSTLAATLLGCSEGVPPLGEDTRAYSQNETYQTCHTPYIS